MVVMGMSAGRPWRAFIDESPRTCMPRPTRKLFLRCERRRFGALGPPEFACNEWKT
jgi:hypothetical protein